MLISIVTPVRNAPDHLEAAMRSVVSQRGCFDLDYVVADGASTDGTLDIVRKFEPDGARWISEADQGMYDAIAKGFAMSSGEVMGWLNADDLLLPGSLDLVARIFAGNPDIQWLTSLTPMAVDGQGDVIHVRTLPGLSSQAFLDGVYVGLGGLGDSCASDFIQQESTFWRRSLWERAGGAALLPKYRLAGDFALWSAFFRHAEALGVVSPLGLFRLHKDQLSRSRASGYLEEVAAVLKEARIAQGRPNAPVRDTEIRYYDGLYAEKAENGRWQAVKRDFAVLPASPLKQALGQGKVF
ncbi:MAG: glycosyltransferase [Rhodospirillales bacterium]|nr:MAG: glycosyltransferase [Rhodospirillales bacterium]